MSISTPFIHRPVGTTLLTIALALAGAIAFFYLPVSPLPQVDFPTIQVSSSLPGASPETMASSVATPLERQFGHIAGVTEMTSTSSLGSTSITLQFDLARNIDAAARDVQAAINAAAGNLPSNLPSNPGYQKVNPADAPILILSLTSDTYTKAAMYDAASSILAQKLSQVGGVGQVNVGGGALPAVRVDVNPTSLNERGLGLEDVRTTLANANVNQPKGSYEAQNQEWSLSTSDQLLKAEQYAPLIVAYRNGSPVRLSDVASVTNSQEDVRTLGLANEGKPAILIIVSRQPGANIISTADRVLALLPQLQAQIPAAIKIDVVMDRTTTIRASVHDTETTLLLSIGLVVLVVFVFLRDVRTTLIPSVVVPVSLIATFGVMYLLGYSIDNLSLMALTIATGFVVDDAIVVIENITRHLEEGKTPREASLLGAKEIGFTVLSISMSLIAVFIPILLMGGIVGRLFREFSVTLSIAITVSLIVSLTTTPMMCAVLLRDKKHQKHGRLFIYTEMIFDDIQSFYEHTLGWVLRHPLLMLFATAGTVALTMYLYVKVPKGFFPQQDSGRLMGQIIADQDTSFQAMSSLMNQYSKGVSSDQDVTSAVAFAGAGRGGGTVNTGRMFVTLNPIGQRTTPADQVIARLRRKLSGIAGATLILQSAQDVSVGGRGSAAQYQYTLQGDSYATLSQWTPKLMAKLNTVQGIADVNSDQRDRGQATQLNIDRVTAARLGITPAMIDSTLYDAFGQRQVSTMYTSLNQYHVIMEVSPSFLQSPKSLDSIYIEAPRNLQVPLSAIARYEPSTASLSINHQGQFPAITLSFNLNPGVALSDVVPRIEQAETDIGLPASIHGSFQGTAKAYQDSLNNQVLLIIAALVTVYIVLGMLYESLVHPITILSTLPSAGVGALLALMLFKSQLDVIAIIGIILLIGIVKKNAIMMIDFALDAERSRGLSARDAIFQASLLRFRPITMTTMAALLGGLPLALGTGTGSEIRHPLGIAIVGGLIVSQMLTLYTTPVIYLYFDRFRLFTKSIFGTEEPHGRHEDQVPMAAMAATR